MNLNVDSSKFGIPQQKDMVYDYEHGMEERLNFSLTSPCAEMTSPSPKLRTSESAGDERVGNASSQSGLHTTRNSAAKPTVSHSPSVHLKSPVMKSRRLVEKIINSYDNLDSPSSGDERAACMSSRSMQCHSTPGGEGIHFHNQSEREDSGSYIKLYDWQTSPLLLVATEDEDDTVVSDMDDLLKKVEQYKDGRGDGSNEQKDALLLAYYPLALDLLTRLHRDLRCPASLHKSFLSGYGHPSAFNFAVLLSRIFALFDSRVLLLELLRAAAGKPSQKLISRIRKERNSKLSSNSSDNAELLSRLNFAGQSPQQIRERARATTISILDTNKPENTKIRLPLADGSSSQKKVVSGQGGQHVRHSTLRSVDKQRKSSLLLSLSEIQQKVDCDFDPVIVKPSDIVGRTETQLLQAIGESDESDVESQDRIDSCDVDITNCEGDPCGTLPRITNTLSVRKSPVLDCSSIMQDASDRSSIALSSEDSSKFHCVVLQQVCEEWMLSLPWKVTQFKFGEKLLRKGKQDKQLQRR